MVTMHRPPRIDPLAPLAWDLSMASLGLARRLDGLEPEEDEREALGRVGQFLGAHAMNDTVNVSDLLRIQVDALPRSRGLTHAALASLRGAIDNADIPAGSAPAERLLHVSSYLKAGRGEELTTEQPGEARAICEQLLDSVQSY